ncbi:MAG TPA: hypothetical protein VFP84_12775 [Kofleriaceae bacterium]|nr:hypothetical protein [Kofleriaceae bacterium]
MLRDRREVLARIARGADLPHILRTMIATIAITMAIVGAALGSYRGGAQIAYAAIKLPIVLVGTAALSAPALWATGAALGRRARLTADLALVTTALAFGALLLAACTPLILLGRAIDLPYHDMILLVVGMFAVAGIAALHVVVRGAALGQASATSATFAASGWRTAVASLCVVFSLVGGQLAWALRPYLVRPRTAEPPFVRELDGSLYDAIAGTVQSAQGIYTRDGAPL